MPQRVTSGRVLALGLVLCATVLVAQAPQPAAGAMDVAAFRAQLQQLRSRLQSLPDHPEAAGDIAHSVPDEIKLNAGDAEYTISFEWLHEQLDEFPSAEKDRRLRVEHALARLDALEAQVVAYTQPRDLAAAHRDLADILSRREFANARGQSWSNRIMQAVARWLLPLLEVIFRKAAEYPSLSRIIFYGIIALGVLLVAYWLVRLFQGTRRRQDDLSLTYEGEIPSGRSWQQWLADAHRAAAAGAWRDAIRLCYWAGISRLESGGAWPPDRARTPREYLRLLPAASDARTPLQDLTRRFELAWYAQQPVAQADFSAAEQIAEQLGCR